MNDITDQDKDIIYSQVQELQPSQVVQYVEDDKQENKDEEFEQLRQEAQIDQPIITVEQMIKSYPSEYFFGIKFDVDSIKNSPFDIQNIKRQLINDINSTPILTSVDKDSWTHVLQNTNDLAVIQRIQNDFNKATNRAKVDSMAKEVITIVCQWLNNKYFNGSYVFADKITLPPMFGSEKDIIDFYMSQNVQTFMQQDARGIKIQKIMTNPGVRLLFNLGLRGFKNTIQLKQAQQQTVKQLDYKFDDINAISYD